MKYIGRGVYLNSGYFVNVYWDDCFNWSNSVFIGMIGTLVIKKYRSRLKKFAIIFGSCLSVFIVSLTLSHIFYPITAEQQAEMDKKAEEKKQLAAKKKRKRNRKRKTRRRKKC